MFLNHIQFTILMVKWIQQIFGTGKLNIEKRFGAPQENFFKILNYQTANKDNTLPDIKDENCHDLYIKRF